MSVGVLEIESPTSTACVDLHVFQFEGLAAVRDTTALYAVEDGVELLIADVEGVVVTFDLFAVVEVQGQGVINSNGGEVSHGRLNLQAEDPGEEGRGHRLVPSGHDGVV